MWNPKSHLGGVKYLPIDQATTPIPEQPDSRDHRYRPDEDEEEEEEEEEDEEDEEDEDYHYNHAATPRPAVNKCRADDTVRCHDGSRYICSVQQCDGIPDCDDGGDEVGCPDPGTS